MQVQDLYAIFLQHPSIQTDTRKLKTGDLFFALKGPNFNGNLFALQALDAGAAFAVIDEQPGAEDSRLIIVTDVLQCLQDLAAYHRSKFQIPFIAITGSNGKTTTKELVSEVLSTTFKTYTTTGNLNNHIGVPLTLLSVKEDAQMAVIEMGANHQKEIESYCRYTMPTHGIITNCGKAHLEGFGSEAGVRKAKGELFDYLREHDGTAFIMQDYDYLVEMSKGIPHLKTYGTTDADIIGRASQDTAFLQVAISRGAEQLQLNTNLVGDYNLPNVLAAVAIGRHFGVEDAMIKKALEQYMPSNSRSQLLMRGDNTIILDAYNANPSSMKAAIENFARLAGNEKVLLLGAMMELGSDSLREHQDIIHLINQHPWKHVVLVGGDFKNIFHHYQYFENVTEAQEWIDKQKLSNAQVLVKGSRSIQMEKVLG